MSMLHNHQELLPLMSWLTGGTCHPLKQESAWSPKVDIKEEKDEFVVYADIPGVDPKNIEIDMEGNTLTVRGERQTIKEEKDAAKSYYRIERTAGKFYRQFTLPENVDSDKISAQAKHGVLAIHLPKAKEEINQRKIRVEEGE